MNEDRVFRANEALGICWFYLIRADVMGIIYKKKVNHGDGSTMNLGIEDAIYIVQFD